MFESINLLKIFAALIIFNSHSSALFPEAIRFISRGGAFGNSLFFIVSGFLLFPVKTDFSKWIKKRYLRIYIPLVILFVILLAIGQISFAPFSVLNTVKTVFFNLVFPTERWFICALIVFYPLYFLVNKIDLTKHYLKISLILAVMYIVIYNFIGTSGKYVVETKDFYGIRFSYIFSFFLMLTGGFIKSKLDILLEKLREKRVYCLGLYLLTFMSLLSYFAFAFIMPKYHLYKIQFVETLLMIIMTTGLFVSFILNEERIKGIHNKLFCRFLNLSQYTLEFYLIQFVIIKYSKKLFSLISFNVFLINYIFVLVITVLVAIGYNKIVLLINKPLKKRIR